MAFTSLIAIIDKSHLLLSPALEGNIEISHLHIELLSFKIQNKNFETDIKRESVGLNVVLLGSM